MIAPWFECDGRYWMRVRAGSQHGAGGNRIASAFGNLQLGFEFDRDRTPVHYLLCIVSRDEPDDEPIGLGKLHLRAKEPWFELRLAESIIDELEAEGTSPLRYVHYATEMYRVACLAVKCEVPPPIFNLRGRRQEIDPAT